MTILRYFTVLTLLLMLFAPASAREVKPTLAKTGTHGTFVDEKLTVNKLERVCRLVVPKSVDLKKPSPLVVAFHGMGIDSSKVMPLYTKLDNLAAEKKIHPGLS
jgi:poly(3-hydroxybutyrate) depolymerase